MSPAVFNWVVVAIAMSIGLASGLVIRRCRGRDMSEATSILIAAAVGAGLSIGSSIVVLALLLDVFAVMHLTYVIGAIGVPLTAAVAWDRSASRWFHALSAMALLPLPLGLYATHVEPFWLRVDTVSIAATAVISDADRPFRIGVLSDVQTTAVGDYELDAVDRLLATEPDIVVIPGDLYQVDSLEDLDDVAEGFTDLLTRLSNGVEHVVAVSGNTDTVDGLRRLAAGTDVVVLDDETIDLLVRGNAVRVLGVTLGGDGDTFADAFTSFGAPAPDGDEPFRLVLAHQPDEVDRFDAGDLDLLVAGHTHGGQISLPIFGPPVTLSSVPRDVAAGGLGEVDGVPVYVSTGVGRERGYAPQIRLGVRPSVGVIEVDA